MQKPGEVLKRFKTKKDKEITLRAPDYNDFTQLHELINSLVDEATYILLNKNVTESEELDYVYKLIHGITSGSHIHLLAEFEGNIVGGCGIERDKGRCCHVGKLGIAIKKGFRHEGIGKILVESILELAKEAGLKVITLYVFSENKDAIALYEKLGFKESGIIEKGCEYRGRYLDDILMTLQLF